MDEESGIQEKSRKHCFWSKNCTYYKYVHIRPTHRKSYPKVCRNGEPDCFVRKSRTNERTNEREFLQRPGAIARKDRPFEFDGPIGPCAVGGRARVSANDQGARRANSNERTRVRVFRGRPAHAKLVSL